MKNGRVLIADVGGLSLDCLTRACDLDRSKVASIRHRNSQFFVKIDIATLVVQLVIRPVLRLADARNRHRAFFHCFETTATRRHDTLGRCAGET